MTTTTVWAKEMARRLAPRVRAKARSFASVRSRVARLEQETAELREEVQELRRLSPRLAALVDVVFEQLPANEPQRSADPGLQD